MTELYPQFISNSPIGEDLFEGKSQERVAKYICENLISNAECTLIGVDGGWGTGKSNLIEITKRKLNETSPGKYHFFLYDAWGHQEDLQRRSILEELTFFLTGKANGMSIISDATKWEKKLKSLLAKSKETQKKTIPSLSVGVVASGLFLLLTPLFKAISEQVTINWLKILVVAIPLFLLFTIFAIYYCKKTDKSLQWNARLNQAIQKLFYIYQKSQQSDTTFETISEDEPSVKKFRDWMRDIAADLGNNQLIIVFDNMDRLPDNRITELWSSIHTFFAEEKYDHIKVIIPFDRQNIKNAFKHTNEDNHSYTDDFINKTFDIVYRVSPPILSDWKKFFESKWLQAFNTNDGEFEKVIQIFDHLAVCKTPRDMVVFINECVAANQINPKIPLQYVALFVLNKTQLLSQSEQEIIHPSYLKGLDFLYKGDENLPKFMAAVIYQIDPDRALEVVFTDRLKSSLNSYDKIQIALISESASFSIILDKAIMEVDTLNNTTLALNDISDKVSAKVWDDLYQRLGLQISRLPDAKISPYQLILLTKVTDKASYLKTLTGFLLDAAKFSSADYHKSWVDIENTIKTSNLSLKAPDYWVEKKINAADFVELLKVIKDNNTYKLYCDNTELNTHLESLDSPEEWSNSAYLSRIPERYKMAKFTEMLTTKMTDNSSDSEALPPYISAYKNVSKTTLKPILKDDAIHNLFVEERDIDEFYYNIICMRIARWENYPVSFASDFEDVLNDDSKETVDGIVMNIDKFVDYGDLLLRLPAFNKPLIKAVTKDITINRRSPRRLHLYEVLAKIDDIIAALGIESKILSDQLQSWNIQDVTKAHIASIISNTQFFDFCATNNSSLTKHLNTLALEYYRDMSLERWLTEFKKPQSKIIATSLTVLKGQYTSNATSAIKEVLEGIANGDIPIPDRSLWEKIVDKLNKSSLRATMKDIRDLYLSKKDIDVATFTFLGDWLFEYGDLISRSESLRRIFKKTILQEVTVKLILGHTDDMIRIYNNSEDKEDFTNEIKVLLTEKRADIIPLANALGIAIEITDEGKNDSDTE